MLNSVESYRDAGRNAAMARNQGDASRAKFESDYLHRMSNLESPGDKARARHAYQEAYSSARNNEIFMVRRA